MNIRNIIKYFKFFIKGSLLLKLQSLFGLYFLIMGPIGLFNSIIDIEIVWIILHIFWILIGMFNVYMFFEKANRYYEKFYLTNAEIIVKLFKNMDCDNCFYIKIKKEKKRCIMCESIFLKYKNIKTCKRWLKAYIE